MFGKGVNQQEEALLGNIIRSVNKKIDYSAHEGDVILDLEDLKQAKNDIVKRHQIRQKIKARCEHLDKSRYGEDILGLKVAKLLRASPKPEPMVHRGGFGWGSRW
jgi:hypothetical protein